MHDKLSQAASAPIAQPTVAIAAHVALVGLPGVGKSSIGWRAAELLGCQFVDLDDAITDRDGRPIPQIFAEDGESAFRDFETATLRAVLDIEQPLLVATGGGIVVRPDNREILRAGANVLWLRASIETLLPRVARNHSRPLFADTDARTKLQELVEQRNPLYGDVASEVCDVDDLTVEQIASCVVELMKVRN